MPLHELPMFPNFWLTNIQINRIRDSGNTIQVPGLHQDLRLQAWLFYRGFRRILLALPE